MDHVDEIRAKILDKVSDLDDASILSLANMGPFICGVGQWDEDGMPGTVTVCATLGSDWTEVYKRVSVK